MVLQLCEGKSFFCTRLISRKLCGFLLIFLTGFISLSVFFLYQSPSLSLCTAFDAVSSHIDEVLSINPWANVFFFWDFNVHHKNWLSYSGETGRPGQLCYSFPISNDFTPMVNFLTGIPVCDSHSSAVLDLCCSSNANICSAMTFSPLGKSDHVVVLVSNDVLSKSKCDAPFHCMAYNYSCADWDDLMGGYL